MPFDEIDFTIADSPLGRLLLAATARGVCCVMIGDSDRTLEKGSAQGVPARGRAAQRSDSDCAGAIGARAPSRKNTARGAADRSAGDGFSMAGLAPAAGHPVRRNAYVSRSGCRDRQADGDPRRCPRLRDQSGGAADPLPPSHPNRRLNGRISVGNPTKGKAARSRNVRRSRLQERGHYRRGLRLSTEMRLSTVDYRLE